MKALPETKLRLGLFGASMLELNVEATSAFLEAPLLQEAKFDRNELSHMGKYGTSVGIDKYSSTIKARLLHLELAATWK